MPLIVEDGTGKEDADTFVSEDTATAYATARGLTVDPVKLPAQLLNATLYIDSFENRYSGKRTVANQALSWPRDGAEIYGQSVGKNVVPALVHRIEMQLIVEQINGVDLFPSRASGQFVKREKVDVIETEYSESVGTSLSPQMTAIDALIGNLFGSSGGASLRSVRI